MKSRHLLQLSLFASALNNYAPVSAQGGGDVIADTICGPTDDRVLSFDLRQGRLKPIGCTAWLISEDVFLTAAHCGVPKERDDWRVHFTFGAEDAPLEDQYQVDYRTFGLGFVRNKGLDWIVGRLKGNEITEMLPGNAQSLKCGIPGCGWYSLGQVPSQASGNSIVITGYGGNSEQDDSFEPYSQRTSIGELVNITSTQLFYTTDSMGGNSGGPIIHAQTGTVIGIHTNGGCRETDGANFGTRIDVSEIMDHISFLMDKSSPTTTTPTAKPSPNGSSQPSSKSNGLTRSAKSRKEGLAKSRKELFA